MIESKADSELVTTATSHPDLLLFGGHVAFSHRFQLQTQQDAQEPISATPTP